MSSAFIKVHKIAADYMTSPVYIRAALVNMYGTENGINFIVVGTVYIQIEEAGPEITRQLEQANGE